MDPLSHQNISWKVNGHNLIGPRRTRGLKSLQNANWVYVDKYIELVGGASHAPKPRTILLCVPTVNQIVLDFSIYVLDLFKNLRVLDGAILQIVL